MRLDIKEGTNLLIANINDLLNEYKSLDSTSPFKETLFEKIDVLVNGFYDKSSSTLNNLSKQIYSLKNRKDDILNSYYNSEALLNKELEDGLLNVKRKYEEKINNLNRQINDSKLLNERKKQDAIQDIEYYKISSLQNIDMIESEYNESINRFNYQYSIAKESYGENIIYYNDSLTNEIKKLNAEYESSLVEYDNETKAMIKLYTSKIQQQAERLEEINKEYREQMSNYKVKKSFETETLNNKIRELVDLKNQKIEEIRKRYANLTSTLNKKREQDNQENTLKNQNIVKEFVYNMDEAEAHLNSERKKYTEELENEQEIYFENQLRLLKAEENEIKMLKNEGLDEKSLKIAYKKINKEYDDIENENYKNHKSIIERINIDLLLMIENNSYQKKRMDIIRTSSIKSLNLEEIKNNKHYQEENNRYEDEMNYEISLTNYRYNIDANNVRLESSIKQLILQNEIQALDAKHQKDIRQINNIIRTNKLEIDFINQTNKLISNYEETKYTKQINYLTVSNLLEIEKCKVLNAFNRKQYDLKILNSKLLLNYSKDKFDLQNEKYEATTNHNIKIDDKKIASLVNNTAYRIKEYSYNEEQEYALLKQNMTYSLDLLSHTVLVNRFKLNIKSLNIALSSFIVLIKNLEEYTSRILNAILTEIKLSELNFNIVKGFINKINTLMLDYHISLVKLFNDITSGIINNHLKFEEEFKFKTVLDKLDEKYNSDCLYISGEKNRINSSIKEIENRIDNITSRISRLELTNSFSYDRDRKSVV